MGHDKQHTINATTDHLGVPAAVENDAVSFDANGLPKDSGYPAAPGAVTFEPMGFPISDDSYTTITWSNASKKLTIAPVGASFDVWVKGKKFTKNAPVEKDISASILEGLWYFYFDLNGDLQASQAEWSFPNHAAVAIMYWDATAVAAIIFADERHGLTMDWATHHYLHDTIRTRYSSGLGLTGSTTGSGAADADAQVAVDDGIVFDEDLEVSIADGAGATRFVQELSPIAYVPIYYLSGATPVWRRKTANAFALKEGAARIQYNLNTLGTWTFPDAPSNSDHVAVFLYATTNYDEPIIGILGQRVDGTIANARLNNTLEGLSLPNLPILEMKPIYRLIFQTSAVYGNTPKARLRDILDYRAVDSVPGTYVPTTHNTLAGRDVYPAHPLQAVQLAEEANTAGVGAPNVLVEDERHKVLTNEGSLAENYETLPDAAAELSFEFVVQDADGMRITAAAGDTIRVGGTVSKAAGYIRSTVIGSTIRLVAINGTEWVATSVSGVWEVETA